MSTPTVGFIVSLINVFKTRPQTVCFTFWISERDDHKGSCFYRYFINDMPIRVCPTLGFDGRDHESATGQKTSEAANAVTTQVDFGGVGTKIVLEHAGM